MNPIAARDGLSREGRRDEGIAAGRRFVRREDRPPLAVCRSRVDYRVLRSWVDHARIDIAGFSATDHAHRSRRGRLAAADFRLSAVGALRRRPATTPSPRRPCQERAGTRRTGVASGDAKTGIAGRGRGSLGPCVRTRQSANASASVPEHDAADSPLTIGQPDCPHDCCPAVGSPQAACGPTARALKDVFATQASGDRGRGLRCPALDRLIRNVSSRGNFRIPTA
jgi:hypothetical protein